MTEQRKKQFICKSCKKEVYSKDFGRFINLATSLNDKCSKCEMETRTDLDRKGRSSKKDKYKSKQQREWEY